jgi:hypothetical protein
MIGKFHIAIACYVYYTWSLARVFTSCLRAVVVSFDVNADSADIGAGFRWDPGIGLDGRDYAEMTLTTSSARQLHGLHLNKCLNKLYRRRCDIAVVIDSLQWHQD